MFTVGVIGLGLIGGSMGAALQAAGHTVVGYDVQPEVRSVAVRLGIADRVVDAADAAAQHAEVLLLATPVLQIIQLLRTLHLSPGTLVLDTGSTKVQVVRAMNALPAEVVAVGGHPVAGKEQSGPQAAQPDLFRGRPFALCPTERTGADGMKRATEVVTELGGVPIQLGAEAHDGILARTSHVPQVVATALARTLREGDERLAGTGLRDMTRLAASDPRLWTEIALSNQSSLITAIGELIGQLQSMQDLIAVGEEQEIERILASGGRAARVIRRETES